VKEGRHLIVINVENKFHKQQKKLSKYNQCGHLY